MPSVITRPKTKETAPFTMEPARLAASLATAPRLLESLWMTSSSDGSSGSRACSHSQATVKRPIGPPRLWSWAST